MTKLRQADADRRRAAALGPDHSEALARGLLVLGTFDDANRAQTLSHVATRLGLPRATARRALLTLVSLGYVRLEDRLFRLTPRVLRLASAYLTSNPVSTILQPACDRIAREVGESCTAAVLEDDDVVMIARAVPEQLIAIGSGIGFRLPAYCTALGRVLLCALETDAVASYLHRTPLIPLTPQTRVLPADIATAIEEARDAGYCFADQEAEPGFRSVAVPIRRFDGRIVAALNIGARAEAADRARMTGPFLETLQRTASELSGFLA